MKRQRAIKLSWIANHYGLAVQLHKLAEECAEYAASVNKVKVYQAMMTEGHCREYCQSKLNEALDESEKELADVLVVAEQIKMLLSDDPRMNANVQRFMNEKVNRQIVRISEEEAMQGQGRLWVEPSEEEEKDEK